MKKIYKLVLKSYLGPLLITFFIVQFVLMMNFVSTIWWERVST